MTIIQIQYIFYSKNSFLKFSEETILKRIELFNYQSKKKNYFYFIQYLSWPFFLLCLIKLFYEKHLLLIYILKQNPLKQK